MQYIARLDQYFEADSITGSIDLDLHLHSLNDELNNGQPYFHAATEVQLTSV